MNQQLEKDMILAMMRDDKTISDVYTFDYMWKNSRSEAPIAAFETGKKYKLEYTNVFAEVLGKTDSELHVSIEEQESMFPLFKWRNGCESAICSFNGKESRIYSSDSN